MNTHVNHSAMCGGKKERDGGKEEEKRKGESHTDKWPSRQMRDREAGEASAGKASDMSKREQLLGCSSGERENSLVEEMRRERERDGESERGKKSYEPRGPWTRSLVYDRRRFSRCASSSPSHSLSSPPPLRRLSRGNESRVI